ncbi:MAG: alpha/beta hydrolase [Anaerolineae bacterium]|nr:alpha/beta hydrolase [Anaerolineae bacterium]
MSAVAIDNDLVHYEVLGRGRPVILVHGWLGSWRYWISTMQQLSTKFRTYALDLWGFGDSSKFNSPDDRYNLDAQVELLDGFMERLGISKAALIGHGLGAAVVIRHSAKYPDRIPRVVAISPPVQGDWLTEKLVGLAQNSELKNLVPKGVSDLAALEAEVDKVDSYAIVKSVLSIRGDGSENGTSAPIDLRAAFKSILDGEGATDKNMLMILHGAQDALVKMPSIEVFQQALAEYELSNHPRLLSIVLDDSSHFPMLDETTKFNRLMSEFLGVRTADELQQLQPREEWRRRMR